METISRAMRLTAWVGVGLVPAVAWLCGSRAAVGVASGTLWALANMWALARLITGSLGSEHVPRWRRVLLWFVKLPLLYAVGAFLLVSPWNSPLGFLAGFSLWFLMLVIGALRESTAQPMDWCSVAFAAGSESGVAMPEAPNLVTVVLGWVQGHEPLHRWLHAWENVVFAWLIAVGLAGALLAAARRPTIIPRPAQNFAEWVVEIFEQLFASDLGPHTRRFLPFLGTLFLYILAMNWALLIPGLKSPTGGLALSGADVVSGGFVMTAALAFCVFLYVQYTAIRSHGLFAYLHHLMGSPQSIGEWVLCIVTLAPVTHILGELVRPLSLALRLFGNITGDDILFGVFLALGVLALSASKLPLGLPLQLLAVPIVLLFGFVQALIFTALTSAYLSLALTTEPTHHKGGE